jgi:hypothetical protein
MEKDLPRRFPYLPSRRKDGRVGGEREKGGGADGVKDHSRDRLHQWGRRRGKITSPSASLCVAASTRDVRDNLFPSPFHLKSLRFYRFSAKANARFVISFPQRMCCTYHYHSAGEVEGSRGCLRGARTGEGNCQERAARRERVSGKRRHPLSRAKGGSAPKGLNIGLYYAGSLPKPSGFSHEHKVIEMEAAEAHTNLIS